MPAPVVVAFLTVLTMSEHTIPERGWPASPEEIMSTRNDATRRAVSQIQAVAPTRTTVLLTGETGTGKGLIARLLHRLSTRNGMPFVAVHCGAIPETLLESELFGHEKGAFTGAVKRKLGRIEAAQGGTLFLDEIGTIAPSAQIKLLQVLQERSFFRVGGEREIEADVRIIAATNGDLASMKDSGAFRSDLYYRISVFPVHVPALRERIEDLEQLVLRIVRRYRFLSEKDIDDVHPDVMRAFRHYDWPGNIRELENLIERACILENTRTLTPESFPLELFTTPEPVATVPVETRQTLAEIRRAAVESVERRYLTELLTDKAGRIGEAASAAGITPRQLHKLMTRYGLRKEDFKPPARRLASPDPAN
jgi:transcriptional regulator with GAF, ATPase, and Fis domain